MDDRFAYTAWDGDDRFAAVDTLAIHEVFEVRCGRMQFLTVRSAIAWTLQALLLLRNVSSQLR